MKDLRILRSRVLLDVTDVAPIRGSTPPSLLVFGSNLDRASEVFYNGISVDEFVVSSPSRLIVRIPSFQINAAFSDLRVFSNGPVRGQLAEVSLAVPGVKSVQGMDRLIQAFMLEFNTTPGSDIFDTTSGGGGRKIVGTNTDGSYDSAGAQLALAIERTRTNLIRKQAREPKIAPSERLLTCNLVNVEFNPETTTTTAYVLLENMLQERAEVSIGG